MSRKKHLEIHNNWLERFDWLGLEKDCPECLVCGAEKHLEMCHLIPREQGGPDTPDNLVLLCHEHHREAPNVGLSKEIMLKWIEEEAPKHMRGWGMTYAMFEEFSKYGVQLMDKFSEKLDIDIRKNQHLVPDIMDFITRDMTVVSSHSKYNYKNTVIQTMKYLVENKDVLNKVIKQYYIENKF